MSHTANGYVKKLKHAPNGEAITATERALLWYLADCHNEEEGGVAWPSVPTLAVHLNVLPRQVRRVTAELVRKEVLGAWERKRENGSTQSNSYYFPALGVAPEVAKLLKTSGKAKEKGKKQVQKPVNPKGVGRSQKTAPGGQPRQGEDGAKDRGGMSLVTGGDVVNDRGGMSSTPPLESALNLHGSPREAEVESPRETAVSPLPPAGGWNGVGGSSTKPASHAKPQTAGAKPAPQSPRPAKRGEGGLTAISSVLGTLVPDRWTVFKTELERRINLLPDRLRADAMDCYRQGIEHTELLDHEADGDAQVWTVTSIDPDLTQRMLTGLKAYVLPALKVTGKGEVQVRVFGAGGEGA